MQSANQEEGATAMLKVLIAWLGTVLGSITLQQIVLTLTLIYTALQVYVLVRDKIVRDRP